MVQETLSGLTDLFTRVTGCMIRCMARVFSLTKMVGFTKVNLSAIRKKDKVFVCGPMDELTTVLGLKASNMDKDSILIVMAQNVYAPGIEESLSIGSISTDSTL